MMYGGRSLMNWFTKIKDSLTKTRNQFVGQVKNLLGKGELTPETWEELEETLIQADTGVPIAARFIEDMQRRVKEEGVWERDRLMAIFKDEMCQFLARNGAGLIKWAPAPPTVMLIVGVNGVGKTTSIAKMAHFFKECGQKVLIAAADTFRAAAIDQLEVWAGRAGVDLVKHKDGADPGAVVFDAVQAAKARNIDLLLIDTAGRLHTKFNLMEELKKLFKILNRELPGAPHETLLVLDSSTGQNAISQAKIFKEAVAVTGLILTKLDGTAKGGMVLGVQDALGIPVKFIGVGEGIGDLREFEPATFVDALFAE